jgi:predicted metal-dependent hydrolase
MRLPIIKHAHKFIEENDEDFVNEAIALLEHMSDARSIKDGELDVIGELLSNFYGALEVNKMIKEDGMTEKDAMNAFMQRVLGSIDQD